MGYGSSMKKQSDPNDPAALLDALMGSTRNMTETEKATSGPRWQDRDVCEKFLVGCCPGNLFHASSKRSDVRPCTLTHAESIRTDYEKTNPSEPGSKRRGIERRLLRELQILVKESKDSVILNTMRSKFVDFLSKHMLNLMPDRARHRQRLQRHILKLSILLLVSELPLFLHLILVFLNKHPFQFLQ